NYIGIEEPPGEMFGKVMSISDELMWRYYELLTDLAPEEIAALKSRCESGEENPRNIKVRLAKLIISDFHSERDANAAEEEFTRRFVQKEVPDEIEEKTVSPGTHRLPDLLAETGLASSKGEAKRLIEQGGVKINGEKVSNSAADINVSSVAILIQVGKRKFLKVSG
ncbi:MAG TPA: S4 domain-containing protein, partial [Pyrinomonadaceae bacterium]|nr:S4 domain-containing protein [Pyrinomonadaceae bacterium]